MEDVKIDKCFIGSCTNGRIEDISAAAAVAKGKKVADHVYAMVVPGSGRQGPGGGGGALDKILVEAGFDWREPGCSMCLAMNPDKLLPQERCASTSNRNFEGRQATAAGRTSSPRRWPRRRRSPGTSRTFVRCPSPRTSARA